jgi:hypothetical protein
LNGVLISQKGVLHQARIAQKANSVHIFVKSFMDIANVKVTVLMLFFY